MPRRLRGPSLPKQDRKLLKSLKGYQMGHIQRLVSVTRSASSAPDRLIANIPPPPIARMECRGGDQVLGLLCRLPNLVHVRSDRYSHLDVIWVEVGEYTKSDFFFSYLWFVCDTHVLQLNRCHRIHAPATWKAFQINC